MMSAYDRWVTSAPEYDDDPELTGLAAEAQRLVDVINDAIDFLYSDWSAEGRFPPHVMAYHLRLCRIRERADARVTRRVIAQDASACAGWGCVDGCGDCMACGEAGHDIQACGAIKALLFAEEV